MRIFTEKGIHPLLDWAGGTLIIIVIIYLITALINLGG